MSFATHGAVNERKFSFTSSSGFLKGYEIKIRLELVGGASLVEAAITYTDEEDIV